MEVAEDEQLRIFMNWLISLKKSTRQRQKERWTLVIEGKRSEEEYETLWDFLIYV